MEIPDRPFRYDELTALGLKPSGLRALLESGGVRRILRGVYVDASLPDDTLLRARAVALVVPPDAVICDRTAAWLHGVDVFEPGHTIELPQVEMVTPCAAPRVRRLGTNAARRDFAAGDVMHVAGVAVTTPLRTACDLGRLRGRSGAFASLCLLGREHGFGANEIAAALPRLKGHRGVVQLRELAVRISTRCESHGEAWSLIAILDAGLPRPETQVEVMVRGFGLVRLDFAYRLVKVAVEYDGRAHHSMPEDRARDERRRAALRADGWIVIVVTSDDLRGSGLDGWLGELRCALETAARPQDRVYARAAGSRSRSRRR